MKIRTMLMLAACLAAPGAGAAQTNGTYVLQGSSYSITVQFTPGTLTVVEPMGKVSPYTQVGPAEYHFRNPTNNIMYGLRVLGPTSIEAFKPGSDDPPTRLELASTSPATGENPEYERLMQLAEAYAEKAESGDAHLWTTCAAAAFTRATQTAADADWWARDAVERLKPIMVNAAVNPCPDVIPAAIWAGN